MHEGRRQTARREDLAVYGKAPSDLPALKPYWGKPAVRNFREDGGNVGIIRSPVRATALPGDGGNVGIIRSPVRATALPGGIAVGDNGDVHEDTMALDSRDATVLKHVT